MKLQEKMKFLFTAVLLLILVSSLEAQDAKKQVFKIEGLSCEMCANSANNALESITGVDSAKVDFTSKKAVVYGDVSQKKIEEVISSKNFEAVFPGEKLTHPLTEEEKQHLDITTIHGGKPLSFPAHLAEGKLTIFDFYADWCGPCRLYSPKLERLLVDHENIALRKVDVVDWDSGLAKQLTKAYKIPALPFTLIFNDEGELVGRVEGNNIDAVKAILNNYN